MDIKTILIVFEIITTIIMIVSYILLIIQSFNNYLFRFYKKKDLTIERLLYEQFYYEVNSNINSYAFTINYNYDYNEPNGANMDLELKINSLYDCRGVKDQELNEKNCQDKILYNYTCCRPECCVRTLGNNLFCSEYGFNLNDISKDFLYNDEEILEDPKRRLCTYYNDYVKSISHKDISNDNLQLYQLKYNYKDLYLNKSNDIFDFNINKSCDTSKYFDCGIIDTKKNHLCAKDPTYCPINKVQKLDNNLTFDNAGNDSAIIIRNILSELPPDIHEWRNHFVNDETRRKMSKINIKEIYKFLNDKKANNNAYQKQELNYKIKDIDKLIDYYKINKEEKINWYTTNYIGFSGKDDIEKFNDKFKSDTDNKLYKIGKELLPALESIIIGFIFFVFCVIYIILNFRIFKTFNKILFYIKSIILIISFIYEISFYAYMTKIFEEIRFDIDDNYKEILNLYNKRRAQNLLLASFILLIPSIILNIISFIIVIKNKNVVIQRTTHSETEENIFHNNSNNNNNNFNSNSSNTHRLPLNIDRNNTSNLRQSENRGLIDNLINNNEISNNPVNDNNGNNNADILQLPQNIQRKNILPSLKNK